MSDFKIAFMFGAGAEGKRNFELSMGDAFQTNTLLKNTDKEAEGKALNDYFNNDYRKNTINDKTSIYRVLKYSLKNYLDDDKRKKTVQSDDMLNRYCTSILSKSDYKEVFGEKAYNENLHDDDLNNSCKDLWVKIIDYMAYYKDKDYKDKVAKEMHDAITGSEHYKNFFHNLVINKEDNSLHFSDEVVFAVLLDQKFHTIIDRNKYGKNSFYMVFNYYWHCYFYIIKDVIKYFYFQQDHNEKVIELLKDFVDFHEEDVQLKYDNILTDIHRFTKSLYTLTIDHQNCYYHYIQKAFHNHISGIITTNYFHFAEGYFKNVAYVNGQLKNFEFPEELEVHDASVRRDVFKDRLFFPFIFGQSYVKPIIHPKQIDELKKMKNILDQSSILVILGYNINSDDNHINAYLHDFAQHKKIIFVSDGGNIKSFMEKLHLKNENNIELLLVKYENNDVVIGDIFKYIANELRKLKGRQS